MSDLKIGGGFTNQPDDIIIKPVTQEVIEETPVVEETIEEVVQQVEETPVVEETVEEVVQTVEEVPVNISSALVFEDVVNNDSGISDDILLKHLSDKLGKQISNFSELLPQNINPLDNDPYLKSIVEWRDRTGRPIEDWVRYQKDYSSVSDLDVVSEVLRYKYPSLTNEELQLEMTNYISTEDDYGDEASRKNLELKKLATEGRQILNQLKSEFNTPSSTMYSKEVQEDLKLAQEVKESYRLEQDNRKAYNDNIQNIANRLSVFKVTLPDGSVLDYKVPDQSKRDIPSLINEMPHWKNTDGSTNYEAIVKDALKIKHFDDIIKMISDQMVNKGIDSTIKETNNINFTEPSPTDANLNKAKGVIIEGFDNLVGGGQMKFR